MLCQKCENQMSEDAAFCPKCGTPAASTTTAHTEEPETITNAADTSKNKVRTSELLYGICEDLFVKFLSTFVALHVLGWGLSKLLFSLNALPYYHEGILLISFIFAAVSTISNFDKILEASRVDGPKTPFYKHPKFWMIIAALVIVGIVGRVLGTDTPKGELRDYMKNKMPIIMISESKVDKALNDVSGENYTDDMTTYAALKHEIVPNTQKWLESAENVHVEDERLKTIHDKYINYVQSKLKGLELYLTAIEQQNEYDFYLGNEKIEESNALVSEYITEVNAYCEELGIESNLHFSMPEDYQQPPETSTYANGEQSQLPGGHSDEAFEGISIDEAQRLIEKSFMDDPNRDKPPVLEYYGTSETGGRNFHKFWWLANGEDKENDLMVVDIQSSELFAERAKDDAHMPFKDWHAAMYRGEDPWRVIIKEEVSSVAASNILARVTAEPSLRMREKPETESYVLTSIPHQEIVEIVYDWNPQIKWTMVQHNGLSGWVSTEYLEQYNAVGGGVTEQEARSLLEEATASMPNAEGPAPMEYYGIIETNSRSFHAFWMLHGDDKGEDLYAVNAQSGGLYIIRLSDNAYMPFDAYFRASFGMIDPWTGENLVW